MIKQSLHSKRKICCILKSYYSSEKKKNLRPDRESQPDRRNAQSIELINPTGEQAIVSS